MTLDVGPGLARSTADAHRSRLAGRDPLFSPWLDAHAGEPVVVHTVDGVPSYWLVPVEREERVIGFVRVIGAGCVAAAGAYYRRPEELSRCPTVVTGVTRSEAETAAVEAAEAASDQLVSSLFVHAGPPGREAWLVEVGRRRFFVSPGGVRETIVGSD